MHVQNKGDCRIDVSVDHMILLGCELCWRLIWRRNQVLGYEIVLHRCQLISSWNIKFIYDWPVDLFEVMQADFWAECSGIARRTCLECRYCKYFVTRRCSTALKTVSPRFSHEIGEAVMFGRNKKLQGWCCSAAKSSKLHFAMMKDLHRESRWLIGQCSIQLQRLLDHKSF